MERTRERKFVPESRRVFGMFFDGAWYRLTPRPEILTDDPVEGLDVSLLQNHLLGPVLGIEDPRTDKRGGVCRRRQGRRGSGEKSIKGYAAGVQPVPDGT